ncbi:unnamed protein product [Adineta steineri]|uniref:Uncharacterized protein n=1 Tax=Adineta steineri TaxID=433720 RepID=A0A815PDI0_9BILA|nr:unnamed protein product [Adineta steineri]
MKIPINEYKEKLIDQYSIATETETLHTSNETNEDYYQSILSKNDIPYFPNETILEKILQERLLLVQQIAELNKQHEMTQDELANLEANALKQRTT